MTRRDLIKGAIAAWFAPPLPAIEDVTLRGMTTIRIKMFNYYRTHISVF